MDCEEVVFGLESHLKKLEIDTFEESKSEDQLKLRNCL
jgi:hypothetical protein